MSVLDKICAKKRDHVEFKKSQISLDKLKFLLKEKAIIHSFISNLINKNKNGTALIAEVKKASPSKGIIRKDFDPVAIAKIYESSGATCLSVLTDEPYFQGHDDYFKAIREAVSLPMLRKDFMIDPYQIYESRALGADCILLIMACLSDTQASELYDLAISLNMDALVEVHDEKELNRALALKPKIIGVNNRNLKTLEVNLQTGLDLSIQMPKDIVCVAESGITSYDDIQTFKQADYSAFLVGESLMRQDDIALAVRHLINP